VTPELTVLVYVALLQVLQFCAYSVAANMQIGPKVALGPRDSKIELQGTAGRLQRALTNHYEGLILFTIACVVLAVSGQSTPFTQACAWVYLAARIAYVPAYVIDIGPWRSLIWLAGLTATILMLIKALP
jgi:uncharacterized MAPEG superfamily protein